MANVLILNVSLDISLALTKQLISEGDGAYRTFNKSAAMKKMFHAYGSRVEFDSLTDQK